MSSIFHLGDLQYAIMRLLWSQGEASAAEVHSALYPDRGLAPTTIATMLSKMEKKGVVTHRIEGRQFVYRAVVDERDVRLSMVGELINRVFKGDAAALVNHLLKEEEIDPNELKELKALIEARERKGGGGYGER
jgi:predicted transcriptional regulator